jgi:hypothetical protein
MINFLKRDRRDSRSRLRNEAISKKINGDKYPKQINIKLNEKQANLIKDWRRFKRRGYVELTVSELFRAFVDQLEPQMKAIIKENNILDTHSDFIDHPKRQQDGKK